MRARHLDPQAVRKECSKMAREMQGAVQKTREPQLRAIYETSAEVLNSLAKTFSDYEVRSATAKPR